MSAPFEARYIEVLWQDKSSAKKIYISDRPLDVEEVGPDLFKLDVINYSRIENGRFAQFAVRLLEKKTHVKPRFLLNGGNVLELISVKDPVTGIIWWIEAGEWINTKGRKYWESRILQSVGKVDLKIGSTSCEIHINSSTFTYEELEKYLKNFRNDFWELILEDSSYVKGTGRLTRHDGIDESGLRAISKFIEHVENVLAKPKVELREIQRLKNRKNIRPVPRTFMELSTRGDGRLLTSRDYDESWDIPENRYVHNAIQKIFLIIKTLTSVVGYSAERLRSNIENYHQRLDSFSDVKNINEEAVRNDLADKISRIDKIKNKLKSSLPIGNIRSDHNLSSMCLTVTRETTWDNTFFINIKENPKDEWWIFKSGYATITFPDGFVFEKGFDYQITGDWDYTEEGPNENGNTRHSFKIIVIETVELIGGNKYAKIISQIKKAKNEVYQLEKSNWKRPLSQSEREEQEKEIASLKKIIDLHEQQQDTMKKLAAVLKPKLPIFRRFLRILKDKKVKPDSTFPNSMSFVQNPNYQGIHSSFKTIKDMAGVDDSLLLALQQIDEIGLTSIPVLYERWCLLQIIKVLIQRYHYKPENNWKRNLIKQVLQNGTNVIIHFANEQAARQITLSYELILDSGKRPDFVLDVEADCWADSTSKTKRFVLDAKFYENINMHGGISKVIDELYYGKDYSEDGKNTVFILHPSKASIPKRKTPQNWAENSFYGEIEMFGWDQEMRSDHNHKYGAIYLSPIGQPSYLDELQRGIGMFLQYGLEDNNLGKNEEQIDPKPDTTAFCLSCGSVGNFSYNQIATKSGKGVKWWVTCNECNHFAIYSYCNNCQNRLIKNGDYWSYHAMEPLNPINIKCPACASMF